MPSELHVPRRCQRVFDLLCLVYPRCLKIKDIIDRTGHPADERKLRELRALNPGLIRQEWHKRDGRGWYEYGIAPEKIEAQGRLAL